VGEGELWDWALVSLYFHYGSAAISRSFAEHAGSTNSAVFTWMNNGKLEVAQHIADYETGHSAAKSWRLQAKSSAKWGVLQSRRLPA
jgi:hypothetical protein